MTDPTDTMRGLIVEAPATDTGTTRVAELPVPEPGPGEVTIDVHYAGVNFKDVMARRGDPGYVPAWPFVPGLEVAGTVRAVGEGVRTLHPGRAVSAYTGAGGLAEVAVASGTLAVPVPPGLDLARAAVAPGALTSAALLLGEVGRLRPGETVLVHGAGGGVGRAALGLARRGGASRVLGTVGSSARVAPALRAGFDAVLARDGGWVEGARGATAGRGVDLVLDPQGTDLLEDDLAAGAAGVRIVLFGNAGGAAPGPLPPLGRLMGANATLTGFSLAALAAAAPDRVAAALAAVLDDLADGSLTVGTSVVDGLAQAPGAQQRLAEGNADGKYVVRVR